MPRGKGLGGSSSMLYVRGHPLDYEKWVRDGASGWGWQDVRPCFLEAEDNERGAGAVL
jgi:choline dehydrogenase